MGLFTCVTGVSGSGKSTLVNDTLYAAVARQLYRAHEEPAPHQRVEGMAYSTRSSTWAKPHRAHATPNRPPTQDLFTPSAN